MKSQKLATLKEAEDLLTGAFPVFVAAFARNPAFTKSRQLSAHAEAIAIRRQLGSAQAALNDRAFLDALYATLRAWGIGSRGSRLLSVQEFGQSLKQHEAEILALDSIHLDDAAIDTATVGQRLWHLLNSIRLVANKAALVPTTKAMHHLLPDLVVPMDRAYTRRFFGWNDVEFQQRQDRCFEHAFACFHRVATAVHPAQYVGTGWHTSKSKVIDNALVGVFVVAKRFSGQKLAG